MKEPAKRRSFDELIAALLDGDRERAIEETVSMRDAGVASEDVLVNGVERAMERLDAKCTVEQFNLLEIMLCGRAVKGVVDVVYPPGTTIPSSKGTILIAALEGDVHDLGKNIVRVVLSGAGYRVVDCGKDCPLEELIETARRESPFAVGVSGLLSIMVPKVMKVKESLRDVGLGHVLVLAGGAALKQSSAERLNVDFVAQTAFDGLHFLNEVSGANG